MYRCEAYAASVMTRSSGEVRGYVLIDKFKGRRVEFATDLHKLSEILSAHCRDNPEVDERLSFPERSFSIKWGPVKYAVKPMKKSERDYYGGMFGDNITLSKEFRLSSNAFHPANK
jgi:hypothetical protein